MKKKMVMGVVAALLVSVAGVSMAQQTEQGKCHAARKACFARLYASNATSLSCLNAYDECLASIRNSQSRPKK